MIGMFPKVKGSYQIDTSIDRKLAASVKHRQIQQQVSEMSGDDSMDITVSIGVEAAALCKENTALHCMGHLVRGMVTEYYIQAKNTFRFQKCLQNSTTNPRALLHGLIQDGFVEKDNNTVCPSFLALLLGWEKHFTLEYLEFDGLEFTTLQGCSWAPSPSHLCMGHLESLMDVSEPPMVLTLVKKSPSKSKPWKCSPPATPLSSSESSDLGNEDQLVGAEASKKGLDDEAVAQGSEADGSGEVDLEVEEDEDGEEEADDDEVPKCTRSVDKDGSSDGPAPPKKACRPSRKQGKVTSAPQVALDSSANIILPKQLAKQFKTAGPSQMKVVIPQTTTSQLCCKLFQKPKMQQAEGSLSKTKHK
ncbi:hypothetical protein BT96DRAFT_943648 [Gymnopus androsaceus JB14]|uniref:Uncharacterized protein n=1 Tax=Gymnopus androsaceus JB14 TaxID=1447944 RepID=A0A6A4H7X0_9AGAR|nr:hypothetical protein BT96DRAFT_943648 [Gymnopus androsaceus JB14]